MDSASTTMVQTRCTSEPHHSGRALAQVSVRDRAAFAGHYREYLNRVYSYLLARVGNIEDAQDLTSQTFLAALENIDSYQSQRRFGAWLFGIARHKCVDHVRRRPKMDERLLMELASELPAPGQQPAEAAERELRLEKVAAALRALAPDRAEALRLCLFGELSAAEAGEVMGKSEAAIKMLIHRAVRDLKVRLWHWREVVE